MKSLITRTLKHSSSLPCLWFTGSCPEYMLRLPVSLWLDLNHRCLYFLWKCIYCQLQISFRCHTWKNDGLPKTMGKSGWKWDWGQDEIVCFFEIVVSRSEINVWLKENLKSHFESFWVMMRSEIYLHWLRCRIEWKKTGLPCMKKRLEKFAQN